MDKKTQFYEQMLTDVARLWDVEIKDARRVVPLAGSPERSEFRTVVESIKGDLFVLERLISRSYERKKKIAQRLDRLAEEGLEWIIPYRKNRDGEQILPYHYQFWQIQDYYSGVELDHPQYAFDEWRGRALADFLIELKRREGAVCEAQEIPFRLQPYVFRLVCDVETHDPWCLPRMRPAIDLLKKNFFPAEKNLPCGFCHGDFHPLNVIWSPRGIGAVIDWEFCGMKTELYDAALLVGCLGVEDPEALTADCVCAFLERLQAAGLYQRVSWRYFFELVLAARFGWMAEWLRKKDLEMVEMELDYWDILLEERAALETAWRVSK